MIISVISKQLHICSCKYVFYARMCRMIRMPLVCQQLLCVVEARDGAASLQGQSSSTS